jgi:tRNA modification GTPase
VAIVSEEAGTTRDVIEVHLDLGGIPVILSDTAGIREARGRVEAAGIDRALARVEDADIVLWLADATDPARTAMRGLGASKNKHGQTYATHVMVMNKLDLAPNASAGLPEGVLAISAKTGEGLDRLIARLETEAQTAAGQGAGAPLMTRARHRAELEAASAALQRFADKSLSPELKAEELRIAAHHLGRLTGRIDVEEVLGAIFAEFCIGK